MINARYVHLCVENTFSIYLHQDNYSLKTDRQTDRQIDRQTDRQTDRQGQIDIQKDR